MKKSSLFLLVACVVFGLCTESRASRANSVVATQAALVSAAGYEAVVAPGSLGALRVG